MKKTKIKNLPLIDRPREKLIKYGPGRLSNEELLAIIISSGKKGESALELSKKIIKKIGFSSLPNVDFSQLFQISGIGIAKACQILSVVELGKRLFQGKKARLYLKPKDVFEELKDIRGLKKEYFVVFYLNVANQEIAREIISIGSLNTSIVHPREVFEPAVRNLAGQIIIAHNHPSGDPKPSLEDIKITERLIAAGKILGIEIIDHVIVTVNSFFSFKEKKLI